MKKTFLLFTAILLSLFVFAQEKSLYDLKANTIDGEEFNFSELKGQKVLVVNTASKCTLTEQVEELQELYEKYGKGNFTIVGFPSNDFGSQEYDTNEEIKEFMDEHFGVSFHMMERTSVKGDEMNPVYKWLTNKEENGVLDTEVSWNYQKFLIDENGKLVKSVDPQTKPTDETILNWINE